MWRLVLLCAACVCVRGVRGEADGPCATLCLPGAGAGACSGALLARRWLLARASCLAPHASLGAARLVLRAGAAACDHVQIDGMSAGDVMARFVHPRFVWRGADERGEEAPYDAALVLLARPAAGPPPRNATRALAAAPGLESWARHVMAQFPATRDRGPPAPRLLASSPAQLLALTVLLPVAALLLLFVLLLRFTGPDDVIPYDTLPHDLTEPEEKEPPPPEPQEV